MCKLKKKKFVFSFQVGPPGLLYVNQREMAVVASHDKSVTYIGSDDATTCIIVIVRHLGKRKTCHIQTKVWNFF